MGIDLIAYLDINPNEIEMLIDPILSEYRQSDRISAYYNDKHPDFIWYHNCNENTHKVCTIIGTKFIQYHERLDSQYYHDSIANNIGQPFPDYLSYINIYVRTSEDALKVAEALNVFFANDERLQSFADWLTGTAKICSTYDLSY